jgi:hypothetical protein
MILSASTTYGYVQTAGSFYLPSSRSISVASRAYLGANGAYSVQLDIVPVGGSAVASFSTSFGAAAFADVSLSAPVFLAAGWYDVHLLAPSVGSSTFIRGLYLAA